MVPHGDFELDEQPSRTERLWRIQRIGWVAMLLFVAGAILGLFGAGPLDHAYVRRNGLEIAYSRFQRMTSEANLEVTVLRAPADMTRVWVDQNYIGQFEISSVTPQPESTASSSGQVRYAFRSKAGERLVVSIRLRASEGTFGPVTGKLGVDDVGEAAWWQLIWP